MRETLATGWVDAKTRQRFLAKVEVDSETGCWNWQGCRTAGRGGGYGQFAIDGKVKGAHRVSYEAYVEPIPEGYEVDHLCRNHACVNPEHLEAVTASENQQRAADAKTHCKYGHPFNSPDSRYMGTNGSRTCRACQRLRWKRNNEQKKAERHARGLIHQRDRRRKGSL